MFCNYCRAVNPDDAVYCNSCGRTIQKPVEANGAEQVGWPASTEVHLKNSAPLEVPNDSQVSADAVAKLSPSATSGTDSAPSAPISDEASDTEAGSFVTSTSETPPIQTSVVCPRCKLTNPDTAERCDCGYEFGDGAVNDGSKFFPMYATMGQRFTA